MDRYQRVEKPREESQINENEIRITAQGRMRSYITYATTLLQYTDEVPNGGVFHPKVLCQVFDRVQHMPEKGSNEIVFKAMGRAINKTVMIVELIKRRIVGLHQITAVGSTDITDTWEPLEEGLLPLETTRHVSMIIITLSKVELDTNSVGYQPPLPKDQVKPLVEFDYDGEGSPNGRGRGHGGRNRGRVRGNGNMVMDYGDVGYDNRGRGYGGRGGGWARGRGRSFRGHGRGGYVAWSDYPQENGGYHGGYDEFEAPSPGQGRGRGRGHGRGRGPSRGRGRGGYNRVNGGGNNGEA